MAEQIAVFGGFGDAVVDAGEAAGDRAEDATGAEFADQVFVKQVQVSRIHERDLPRRNGFVNNCNNGGGGVMSEGWPAHMMPQF